jgi:hypothetical protein
MQFTFIIAFSLVGGVFGAPAPMYWKETNIKLGRDGKAIAPYELDTRNAVERQSSVCTICIEYHFIRSHTRCQALDRNVTLCDAIDFQSKCVSH